jgi:mono/diheme cytochrome c family protein
VRSVAGAALILLSAAAIAAESGPDAGRRVYQAQCASCHGGRGEGAPNWQEPDKHGEMPAPPHDRNGHTWKHADGMLYRIVEDGWRDSFNKTQRLTMPPFGQTLTPGEIRAVIDYLKTLWKPEQRRFQDEESRREPYPPEAQRAPGPVPIQPQDKEQ